MMALVLTLALLLAACPVTPRIDDDGVTDGGALEEHSELFVDDGGSPTTTEFVTNDTRFVGPYGYTLWALEGEVQTPFVAREATAAKVSGDRSAGFGLVFCAYESADPLVGETMLVVMINTQGEFIVGEVAGGEFRELVPWTFFSALRQGFNQANAIGLAADEGEVVVSLNGSEAVRFRDEDPPFHDGGADGYLVVISPLDRFPEVPVHVLFREGP